MKMQRHCPYEYCDAPDVACNKGFDPIASCPIWRDTSGVGTDVGGSNVQDVENDVSVEENNLRPAWSGNSLGQRDLEFVASRSRPHLIGIVGPENAGKTTLLTLAYLLASRGERLAGAMFAGSYSIGGWESLASSMRWNPGDPPTFPLHTSSKGGRLPGLLHMGLRRSDDSLHEVLFTDAPGEWFTRWALEKSSPAAEGARWIHRNADAFILVADSEALAGDNRGEARGNLQNMARRLSDDLIGRRVAVIWSKSDIVVPAGIRTALKRTFDQVFSSWNEFAVSVHPTSIKNGAEEHHATSLLRLDQSHKQFLAALDLAISFAPVKSPGFISALSVSRPNDPFLAFRGHEKQQ